MKIATFNVNGIRAVTKKDRHGKKHEKDFENVVTSLSQDLDLDILCLQEIKTQDRRHVEIYSNLYKHIYCNFSTIKKGYSGTAILSKYPAKSVWRDFEKHPTFSNLEEDFCKEGRMITLEFDDYYLINVYTPNSGRGLDRRMLWDILFREYCASLDKPYIICGDLNCAHEEIDVFLPSSHRNSCGFLDEERSGFSKLLRENNLKDCFREFHPCQKGCYTFWSPFYKKRGTNNGWRIDYFLVSEDLWENVEECEIYHSYYGSDHCPLFLKIK